MPSGTAAAKYNNGHPIRSESGLFSRKLDPFPAQPQFIDVAVERDRFGGHRLPMSQPAVNPDFVRLLTRAEPRIFAYIHTHITSRHDVEDVFQQTVTVLWTKFDQFEQGTNFLAWALKVAALEIRMFYRKQDQQKRLFSAAFLKLVGETSQRMAEDFGELKDALAGCLQKLQPDDRDVVHRYYYTDATVATVASDLDCPIETVRTVLKRSRRNLYECIQRTLAREEHP